MTMDQSLRNINLFAGMIHSSARLSAWCFSMKSGKLFYSTCPHEDTFLKLFQMNGCMAYAFSDQTDWKRPVFLSDPIGMIWAADYVFYSEKEPAPALVIVMGPIFSTEVSVQDLQEKVRDLDFSLSVRRSVIEQLQSIPVLPLTSIFHYMAMMHYAITEEEITSLDFQYQHREIPGKGSENPTLQEDYPPVFQDRETLEQTYTLERTILQLIRAGNIGYKDVINTKTACTANGKNAKTLREEKDALIILTGLALRAAMDGGIPQRTVGDLEAEYLEKIEKARTIAEVIGIRDELLQDLTGRVHQCQSRVDVSKPVQACCDFIEGNLTKKLELSDIAKAIGYSEYYLTKKFYREMGVRLADYVKEKRIELARVWLVTTTKDIQEISDQLQFSSRGYFSRVFREKTGISPGAYRERTLQAAGTGEREGKA